MKPEKLPKPFQHQARSIKFFSPQDRTLDASDPGTGKTFVAIDLIKKRSQKSALILAPRTILRSAWEEDFAKFAPGVRTSIAFASNREQAFLKDADVYITNIDAAVWLAKQSKKFFDRFDTLVLDEIPAFKHHTSQRSRAINKIKRHFRFRHGMSGTLNSNTITDVWNPVNILDDGKRLGRSFYAFRNAVCQPEAVSPNKPNIFNWVDKDGSEEVVASLLADITMRHKLEECTDIPRNYQRIVKYFLTDRQQHYYDEIERNAMAELDGRIVTAINGGAVLTKLLQVASGAVYAESLATGGLDKAIGKAVPYKVIDTDRYELVLDLVEERPHSVVFYLWKHQRDQITALAARRGLSFVVIDGDSTDKERSDATTDFQAGKYRFLLAHPKTAGHGLTLTRATATIWASPTYDLDLFTQGFKRIYRIGQTQRTETIVIVASGTREESVYAALQAKDMRMAKLLGLMETT